MAISASQNVKIEFTKYYNVINSKLTSSSETRHSVNPANRQPNPEVPIATQADLDEAVAAAQKAFPLWSQTPIEERRAALRAFADALEAQKKEFENLLTVEQGKVLSQSELEVEQAIEWTRFISAIPIPETVARETATQKIVQRYTPIGVVAGIVPWNYPVLLSVGKIVPALYTGNVIIIKPSPFTPYCGLKIGELATHFFPPGVLQVLSGDDSLGPMMTIHPGIDKVTFTGSSVTGKKVMESCAATLKRVTLELGGNDPAIVCEDVDIDAIIPRVTKQSFWCSAQTCMMIKRLYVHEKIYDKFLKAMVEYTKSLKMGDGLEEGVFIGPVQNGMQYEKVKDLFTAITTEGLTPALGGEVKESKGYFITPTLIDNPPEDSRVVTEEAFGPILPLLKWSTEDDVVARANDTKMGLGASVWSSDIKRAERIGRRLESGSVWINSHFAIDPGAPFGGHKWSGIGVEWGLSGLLHYCNSQSIWIPKE